MNIHRHLGNLIDAFRPADGPPPHNLLSFFRWCLSGAWGGLTLAAVSSALGGAALVLAADIVVRVVLPGRDLKLGVVMALIGAPVFLQLIWRQRRGF